MKKFVLLLTLLLISLFAFSNTLSMISSVSGSFQKNFNPYFNSGTTYTSKGFIYETLFYINGYTGETSPWLAKEYKWADDLMSMTVDLRNDVYWHDGEKFNSDDVINTFEMIKDFPALDTGSVWKNGLEKVEKVDDYKIKFILNKINTLATQDLFSVYIVPKHIWGDLEDPSKYADENPIGTGAFKLDQFTSQVFTLIKNDKYWQEEKVHVDKIRIPAFTGNDTAQLALMNGEIDWGTINFPNMEKIFVGRDKKHNHYWLPGGNPVAVYFNLSQEPFSNKEFRRAIAHAMDTDQIILMAMTNYASKANPVGIKEGFSNLIDDSQKNNWFKKDIDKAKNILKNLGYKEGRDGIFQDQNGKKLSFELMVPAGWTDWIAVTQLVSSQAKKIGVDLIVSQVDFGSYMQKIKAKDYQMAVSWSTYGESPYNFYENFMHSKNAYSGSNRSGWTDEKTDELIDVFRSTSDENKRKDAMFELQEILLENIPAVLLFYNPVWFEYSTKNFTGWPSEENNYTSPRITGMDKMAIILNLKPVK
ncbi:MULTISPECIES: ABC transporter substrate-binding protein [Oceanotoga]|uniref:Peptide/nickel transport system substrate-binding protein n=1 Tax=Oceanotoga teriensis TaxID=515440 RepID=A0AA45C6J4_9BACT|nr:MULTISPECIES: ABC transporter substrate-binding protein [Oceanotoga]MDN5342029.1 peptide/nickel transport system substrate-binding protein [Oceanotoga sp.]MDO7976011.1 ABC transporter substrate-binding protein [Oceanotoga teriensis]PWJ92051.1 peptide/nickel transport system substrate-binding protein [Oceanotoga teriensis]